MDLLKKANVTARAKGQAMVEYGLILVLVSVVAIVGLTTVGGQLYTSDTSIYHAATTSPVAPASLDANSPAFNQIIFALSNHTRGN